MQVINADFIGDGLGGFFLIPGQHHHVVDTQGVQISDGRRRFRPQLVVEGDHPGISAVDTDINRGAVHLGTGWCLGEVGFADTDRFAANLGGNAGAGGFYDVIRGQELIPPGTLHKGTGQNVVGLLFSTGGGPQQVRGGNVRCRCDLVNG